jgi:TolA-binding protein
MFRRITVPPRRINPCFISLLLLLSKCAAWLAPSVPVCFADEDAEIYMAREKICALIEADKLAEAKTATGKLAIEFTGYGKLPGAFYWIAMKYEQKHQFEDAKRLYQQIVQKFPDNSYADRARLGVQRMEAMLLVMSENYEQAQSVIDQMAVDFAENPDLPGTLYWIAGRYDEKGNLEKARQNYQRIIEDFPDSPYAEKAKLFLARTNAISLIVAGDYNEAQKAIDKLAVDFAGNPDLPGTIFWITERFERANRFEEAKNNYQRIVQNYPGHTYAKKAKLSVTRVELNALVASKDFNEAEETLNEMVSDFNGHPDLPKTLYWLAERYKGLDRPEVNQIYAQLVQNYPDNYYAKKIAAEHKEFSATEHTEVAEVNCAAWLAPDANLNIEAEKASVELYRIARGYEDSNDVVLAKQTYEQIIKEYPGTIKAENCVLDIRRLDIWEKIDANESDEAEILIDKFIGDFNQKPYANDCLDLIAEKCYLTAVELKKQKQQEQAQDYFAKAEDVWQRLIDSNLPGDLGKAYYYAAGCRQEQKDWDGAINYFQKVVDDYPGFEYACNAQAAIGWCCEILRDSNEAPKEAIEPLIEEAYKRVLDSYPDCYAAGYAAYRLGELSVEKGDEPNAIVYYRKFLILAGPNDTRIESVKTTLVKLEGAGK